MAAKILSGKVNPKTQTIEIPLPKRKNGVVVVHPDQGLLNIWGNFWGAYENARSRYAEVVRYIIDHKLSRQVIFDTLYTAGRPYNTANSYATVLSNLAKPRNAGVLKDLADGKITIDEARRYSARRQEHPALASADNRYDLIVRKFDDIAVRAREFGISEKVCLDMAADSITAVYAQKWGKEGEAA